MELAPVAGRLQHVTALQKSPACMPQIKILRLCNSQPDSLQGKGTQGPRNSLLSADMSLPKAPFQKFERLSEQPYLVHPRPGVACHPAAGACRQAARTGLAEHPCQASVAGC